MDGLVNPVGFGVLLTSLYMLRFRAWRRPMRVAAYFAFFTSLEWVAARHFLPPGAMPDTVGYLCFALTVPVLVATAIVWRQEQRQREGD